MFTTFAICLAISAILMVVFARHSLPRTWIAFVILSAIIFTIINYWPPHIASPWPMVALVIWLITALVVFEAREIRSHRAIGAMIIMTIVLITIAMFAPKISSFSLQDKPSPSTQTVTTPTYTTWKMSNSDYGNNRWFANGLTEIKNSKTDAEAASAAKDWLEKVKTDPNLLVGSAKYLLAKDVDKTTLVDKDGYATDKAVQLVAELELALGQAKVIVADAPSTGYNSGVENNTVVGSTTSGINGDRKAIRVTLPDGRIFWIMGRCGNIVTKGSPPVPPGKTDQPPIVTPPPVPPTLTPKSSNPNDYQRPGTDNTTDSGIGVKPKVPTVTTPAESTPPVVQTQKESSSGVVDTPTNKPGTETGVIAPKATPTPVNPTPPAPETGVNPPNGGSNNTDPTNPF